MEAKNYGEEGHRGKVWDRDGTVNKVGKTEGEEGKQARNEEEGKREEREWRLGQATFLFQSKVENHEPQTYRYLIN